MRDTGTASEAGHGHLRYSACIVGVQKAATSTLYRALGRHRLVSRSPKKEVHFFDDETLGWNPPDRSLYRCPRRKPHQTVAIDATPAYLFWPQAMERMHAFNPHMLLIASFRDPIERAFSQWSMNRANGVREADFAEATAEQLSTSLPSSIPGGRPLRLRQRSLVSRGLYGQQLRRGLELFDHPQWRMLDFHRLFDDFEAVTDGLTDFLGLPRFTQHGPVPWQKASTSDLAGEAPAGADIERLAACYVEDLPEFSRLSGLDVSRWPTARILAGRLEPQELADTLAAKAGLTRGSSRGRDAARSASATARGR